MPACTCISLLSSYIFLCVLHSISPCWRYSPEFRKNRKLFCTALHTAVCLVRLRISGLRQASNLFVHWYGYYGTNKSCTLINEIVGIDGLVKLGCNTIMKNWLCAVCVLILLFQASALVVRRPGSQHDSSHDLWMLYRGALRKSPCVCNSEGLVIVIFITLNASVDCFVYLHWFPTSVKLQLSMLF